MPVSRETAVRSVVSRNVQKLLSTKGWGPKQLSRASGISTRMIHYIVKKEKSCSIATLADLAYALGVEPWELVK